MLTQRVRIMSEDENLHYAGFTKDVVIAGTDGAIYHIPEDALGQYKLDSMAKESDKYKIIRDLLEKGVSTAAIPDYVDQDGKPVEDAFCYVLNLASLSTKTVYEPE